MKKSLLLIASIAAAAVVSLFVVKVVSIQKPNGLFYENVEALSGGEIIVGPLCIECKNAACSSLGEVYLDNYPA